jgi:hypothetical protein
MFILSKTVITQDILYVGDAENPANSVMIETSNTDCLAADRNTINLDLSDRTSGLYIFDVLTDNDVLRGKIYKN